MKENKEKHEAIDNDENEDKVKKNNLKAYYYGVSCMISIGVWNHLLHNYLSRKYTLPKNVQFNKYRDAFEYAANMQIRNGRTLDILACYSIILSHEDQNDQTVFSEETIGLLIALHLKIAPEVNTIKGQMAKTLSFSLYDPKKNNRLTGCGSYLNELIESQLKNWLELKDIGAMSIEHKQYFLSKAEEVLKSSLGDNALEAYCEKHNLTIGEDKFELINQSLSGLLEVVQHHLPSQEHVTTPSC